MKTLHLFIFGCALLPFSSPAQDPPPNDLIENATVIPALPAQVTGSNVGASTEAGPQTRLPYPVGPSVWWRWTATNSGRLYVDTIGSSFDTALILYVGNPSTNTSPLAYDDDSGGGGASRLEFMVFSGQQIYLSVNGYLGATGDIALSLWQGGFPPRYFNQPTNSVATPGAAVSFGVSPGYLVFPTPPWSYQWRKDGNDIPGATTSTCVITNVSDADAAAYSVLITNALGSAISSNAFLTVLPIWISSQPQSLITATGYNATFSVSASGPAPVTYQWRKDDIDLAGATRSSLTISNAQPLNAGRYSVYVTDALTNTVSSNATLEIIEPYTFVTLAGRASLSGSADAIGGAARFNGPQGIAVDDRGYVYVTEAGNHTIRRISPGGAVNTIAGLARSAGTNDGRADNARFNKPYGLAVDNSGNIFVADSGNHTIRRITPEGTVTTLAGGPGAIGAVNGPASQARFYVPADVILDPIGNLLVADSFNNIIRQITPDLQVSTLAGFPVLSSYAADGPALKAYFSSPVGLGSDSAGNLYIADEYSSLVRKLSADGLAVTTVAGGRMLSGTADGPGGAARFNYPHGAKVDSAGNIYIADNKNCAIRRITPQGIVTTIAGLAPTSGSVDGTGSRARFSQLRGVAVDRWGNLYVADYDNQTIRKGWPASAATGPVITLQPQNQTVVAGAPVQLSVGVGGTGVFSYQWYFDGAPIPGKTNDLLTIISAQRGDSGSYSVVVSNQFGSISSSGSAVRVLVSPAFECPVLLSDGTLRLLFRDCDGALPADLGNVSVEWRTNLPSGSDNRWEPLNCGSYVTNGFIVIDDTNHWAQPTRFYRVLEK